MNYILTMSLSGSSMFIMYIILKKIFNDSIIKKWNYMLLRGSLFYYLIPLPFLKILYKDIYALLIKPNSMIENNFFYATNHEIMITNNRFYANNAYMKVIFFFVVWITVAIIIFAWKFMKYLRFRKKLFACSEVLDEQKVMILLEKLKKEYGVHRNVKILIFDGKLSPFTVGIWKPFIVMNGDGSLSSIELILRHELIHIKRFDTLINMMIIIAKSIHWFNPMVYLLKREMENICEMSCDEIMINEFTTDECEHYAKLIVMQSGNYNAQPQWAMSLSDNNMNINERIINIMKKDNKKNRLCKINLIILFIMAFLLSSISVLAYDDIAIKRCEEDSEFTSEDIKEMLLGDEIFVPEGDVGGFVKEVSEIKYDKQFMDQQGNIYQVEDSLSAYISCKHNYQNGVVQRHYKKSDGSCKVILYNGKRCTKCGYIQYNSQIGEQINKPCTH